MASATPLVQLSLGDFADRVAERSPTPGGGSMAAGSAALGAAAVSMAFRFTSGDKYAEVEPEMARRVEGLDGLRARALQLVDEDSGSYDAVTAAFKLPKSDSDEKKARRAAIQAATKGALEVPFETMQNAVAGLRLAAEGVADINPNLASDCAVGSMHLAAAVEGAYLNVRINAGSLKDKEYVEGREAECQAMLSETRELMDRVRQATEGHLS